jgi:hypothetical protein
MIAPGDIPKLVSVFPLDNYGLQMLYANGTEGVLDIKPLTESDVSKPLEVQKLFNTVRKRSNAITWDNERDLCADSVYLTLTRETISYA